jgi:Homeodomain-like domain-containing protein
MIHRRDEDHARCVDARSTSGSAGTDWLVNSRSHMRDRMRIVLLARVGMAPRAIARHIGCTPGTASKGRVRYVNDRMAGLSETNDRGNEPRYGPEHDNAVCLC